MESEAKEELVKMLTEQYDQGFHDALRSLADTFEDKRVTKKKFTKTEIVDLIHGAINNIHTKG